MCKRNEDCALCATFQGKSLDECKKEKRCEESVLEVQIVDDIKAKTGKNIKRNQFSRSLLMSCLNMLALTETIS